MLHTPTGGRSSQYCDGRGNASQHTHWWGRTHISVLGLEEDTSQCPGGGGGRISVSWCGWGRISVSWGGGSHLCVCASGGKHIVGWERKHCSILMVGGKIGWDWVGRVLQFLWFLLAVVLSWKSSEQFQTIVKFTPVWKLVKLSGGNFQRRNFQSMLPVAAFQHLPHLFQIIGVI